MATPTPEQRSHKLVLEIEYEDISVMKPLESFWKKTGPLNIRRKDNLETYLLLWKQY